MDSIFPVQLKVNNIQDQQCQPIPIIGFPFMYENQPYIISREDQKNIFTTHIYTINKVNLCDNRNGYNIGLNQLPAEFGDVIQVMMNAAAQESQRRMQQRFYETVNLTPTPLPMNRPKTPPKCNFNLKFHYDQATTTDDLRYYQKNNDNFECMKRKVRFADAETKDRATFIDSRLLLGYGHQTIDRATSVDPTIFKTTIEKSEITICIPIRKKMVEKETSIDPNIFQQAENSREKL